MIEPTQLRRAIVRPALEAIGLHSQPAEELLLGTIAQESGGGRYVAQLQGPALGICQMEPATHDDIWNNYLGYRDELAERLLNAVGAGNRPSAERLAWDLRYAVALARLHYYRASEALPAADDVQGQADYWKRHYNTAAGAGTPAEYVDSYRRLIQEGS